MPGGASAGFRTWICTESPSHRSDVHRRVPATLGITGGGQTRRRVNGGPLTRLQVHSVVSRLNNLRIKAFEQRPAMIVTWVKLYAALCHFLCFRSLTKL